MAMRIGRELTSRKGYGKMSFCAAKRSSAPAYTVAYVIIMIGAMAICLLENLGSNKVKSMRRETKGARCIARSVGRGSLMRPGTGDEDVEDVSVGRRMSEGANVRRDQYTLETTKSIGRNTIVKALFKGCKYRRVPGNMSCVRPSTIQAQDPVSPWMVRYSTMMPLGC